MLWERFFAADSRGADLWSTTCPTGIPSLIKTYGSVPYQSNFQNAFDRSYDYTERQATVPTVQTTGLFDLLMPCGGSRNGSLRKALLSVASYLRQCANVNYRHVIGSLVRKPGAFARYRFREQLFPTRHFRLTYDALREWRGERADVEYVRILHLAATTMEATVDSALSLLLEAGESFDYAEVRDLAEPKVPEAPALTLSGQPDLKIYDRLLTVSLVAAGVCA